jgi:hypothetical protein
VTRNSQKVKTKTIHRHLCEVGDGKTNNSNHLGDESCEARSLDSANCLQLLEERGKGREGRNGSRSTLAIKFFSSAHLLLQAVTDFV